MAQELFKKFNERYGGFVVIDIHTVEKFISDVKSSKLMTVDYLLDWVLANEEAEEVVE